MRARRHLPQGPRRKNKSPSLGEINKKRPDPVSGLFSWLFEQRGN